MPRSTSELLLYGLIVAGFLLFNYVTQQLAKKTRQEEERALPHEAASSPEGALLEDIRGREPEADLPVAVGPLEPARRIESIFAVPGPLPRRVARGALFRARQDLRQAIVGMTVLGPCRALEPHDWR